jgi:hypothetical protein
VALAGCDRQGSALLPQPVKEVDYIYAIGELEVVSGDDFLEFLSLNGSARQDWCQSNVPEGTAGRCFYGEIGAPPAGSRGGATFTFSGTDDHVCVIVDPETVFWNQSVYQNGLNSSWGYPDYLSDDGDLDLFGGLSAFYNGSPGVEIGDFAGFYTDSLGRQIEIEYGECFQDGHEWSGIENAHSGRGTVEYCNINTEEQDNKEFTVVLDTYSVPLNDGVLSYGAIVVGAACGQLGIDECTITGESIGASGDAEGLVNGCTERLEAAHCQQEVNAFCCANPEMCGADPRERSCEAFLDDYADDDESYDQARETFCAETELCCEYGPVGDNFEDL